MITQDRKDAIAEALVLKYDFTLEDAHEAVTDYINENPEDIDDDVSNEEAAELINENTD